MYILIALFTINIVSFVMMGLDKSYASNGKQRIPEKTLFAVVLLGGGIGGWLGMRVFHHKTKHKSFAIGFPVITILELPIIIYLVRAFSSVG